MTAPKVERLPGLEAREPVTVAALAQHFTPMTSAQIPALWKRFFDALPFANTIPGGTYGVSFDMEPGGFKYAAAVSLPSETPVPEGFEPLTLPGGKYLVSRITTTGGDLSAQFMAAMGEVWGTIVPASGFKQAPDRPVFEYYPQGFDPTVPGKTIDFYVPVDA